MKVGGGVVAGGLAIDPEGWFTDDFDVDQMQEVELEPEGLQYLTIEQAELVHAMTARIYPSDENGPGAPEAGVVYFIDRQLNDAWGRGDRWYMEGPFAGVDPTAPFAGDAERAEPDVEISYANQEPSATQGWQYPMSPAEAYDYSLDYVEEYCQNEYGSSFVDLDPGQQDAVLEALESGDVDTFRGITPDAFFSLLRQNTLEGMFADPMWGGNREMVGWRLKNFPGTPGALGSYREIIDQEGYSAPDEYRSIADDVDQVADLGPTGSVDPAGGNVSDGGNASGGGDNATGGDANASGDDANASGGGDGGGGNASGGNASDGGGSDGSVAGEDGDGSGGGANSAGHSH